MSELVKNSLILFCSGAGFCIAGYIYRSQHKKTALVCPFDGKCDFVTKSKYATTFGISNTILGMLFYAGVFLYYSLAFAEMVFSSTWIIAFIHLGVILAFCFSLYLLFVQAFVLRHWCSWCVFSASLTTGLFFLVVIA